MISILANHLWQSTVLAAVAAALNLALRGYHARVRYAVWLAASIKFLIPFSLLISAGSRVHLPHAATPSGRLPIAAAQITEPFTALPHFEAVPVRKKSRATASVLFVAWFCGFAGVAFVGLSRWRRIRSLVREALPADLGLPIPVRYSGTSMEPGFVGIFRPVLLPPEGIGQRLTQSQLQAIIAHEMCHARRRDNLWSAIHMLVEAVFWFHPLVWWIGARLVEERECACDEDVLSRGSEAQTYAEGILNVCRFYLGSPLTCVSGVTGSDLKKRIEAIMTTRTLRKLTPGKRLVLVAVAAAAFALPIAVGVIHAQSAMPAFEVASIKANRSGDFGAYFRPSPGRISITNMALRRMIMYAWQIQDFQISGAPPWITSAFYDVEAKTGSPTTSERNVRLMLQSLLADRFNLKVHQETKLLPSYALTIAKTGLKLQEAKEGSCTAIDPKNPPEHVPPQDRMRECGSHGIGRANLMEKHLPIASLANDLSLILGRTVVDKTGLTGPYDIDLKFAPDQSTAAGIPHPEAEPAADSLPTIFTALQDQLGLKLEPAKAPVEILVVDHIERPSEN